LKRLVALAPVAVLVALGLLFALFGLRNDPRFLPRALVGKPVPEVTLPTLADGLPDTLAAPGKGPYLVNVFASWCAPCEIEAPLLVALEARGVPIVGVAYKDAPEKTRAFLARTGDPYVRVLVDREGRAGIELGVSGVPETYLVDGSGRILDKISAPLTEADAARLAARVGR
jgi:cytochrome c biogenesis protein CcmG/thiol:disulfide interchange protein DsbE